MKTEIEFMDLRLGYAVRSSKKGLKQKGVDVYLGSDLSLMAWSNRIDAIILIAADGDYVPAVELAKNAMVNVYLLTDGEIASDRLIEVADYAHRNIKDMLENSHCLVEEKDFFTGGIPSDLMVGRNAEKD